SASALADYLFVSVGWHRLDRRSFPTRRSSDLGTWVARPLLKRTHTHSVSTSATSSPSDARWIVVRRTPRAPRTSSTRTVSSTSSDRKSTRLNSSHQIISYAVFCLKKNNTTTQQ